MAFRIRAEPIGIDDAREFVVVRNDRNSVFAFVEIHLQKSDAVLNAVLKRAERVFGTSDGATTMSGKTKTFPLDLFDEHFLSARCWPEDVVDGFAVAADDDTTKEHEEKQKSKEANEDKSNNISSRWIGRIFPKCHFLRRKKC